MLFLTLMTMILVMSQPLLMEVVRTVEEYLSQLETWFRPNTHPAKGIRLASCVSEEEE